MRPVDTFCVMELSKTRADSIFVKPVGDINLLAVVVCVN